MEESIPRPKRRPWFQFHLSTAIVLMFVAAGLLWLNIRVHTTIAAGKQMWDDRECAVVRTWPSLGWPRSVVIGTMTVYLGAPDRETLRNRADQSVAEFWRSQWPHDISRQWKWLAADFAVALAILAAVGFVCEWRIRRRARHP
ncbi:MAG: hypothetical protein NTW87_20560 [Planctomycetota bacterium]|nr:hypothetical protein [Planctomycetota bacterium]